MTFGRPTMLSRSSVNPPQLIDDEYLLSSGQGRQPQDQESHLAFFTHSISLFDILSEVLSTIYLRDGGHDLLPTQPIPQSTDKNLHDVMRLSSELDRFFANIPSHLRPDSTQYANVESPHRQRSACFNLQANVLYCRFLYTRLLLLRPLLLAACAESQTRRISTDVSPANKSSVDLGSTSFEAAMALKACTLCTSTATSLIDTLHAYMHSVLRNSVWYTVYFAFSAATVLLAARTCHPPQGNQYISESSFQRSWEKAVAILTYCKDHIESAGQAAQVLEVLEGRLSAAAASRSERRRPGEQSHDLEGRESGASGWEDGLTYEREWTAEDFKSLSLSNAWFMQQVTNLDFLELEF